MSHSLGVPGLPRDPWSRRWRRRALTVPAIGLGAALWLASAPLIASLAFIADLVRRQNFATLRLWLLVGAYFWAEVSGLTLLGWAWLRSGFGRDHQALQASAYRVQRIWVRGLWRAVCRVYALQVDCQRPKELVPGPFVVLVRHTSLVDTMIPGVFLGADYELKLRYVLKRELLFDPCLDIAGHWMPNHFVDHGGRDRKRELEALRALAGGMQGDEGVLIYPEGTRFSQDARRRALARLAEHDRELHGLAIRCHHTLPPRAGGTLALLNGARDADILLVEHAGFLGLASVSDLWHGTLTGRRIRVRITHIPRAEVPTEAVQGVRWLFDRWARVDAWVSTRESNPGAPAR